MAESGSNTYVVQKFDTLASIAMKFDVTTEWIRECNSVISDFMMPGTVLNILPLPEYRKHVNPAYVRLYHGKTDAVSQLVLDNGIISFEVPREKFVWKADILGYVDSEINPLVKSQYEPFIIPGSQKNIQPWDLSVYVIIYEEYSSEGKTLRSQQFIGVTEQLAAFDSKVQIFSILMKEDNIPIRLKEDLFKNPLLPSKTSSHQNILAPSSLPRNLSQSLVSSDTLPIPPKTNTPSIKRVQKRGFGTKNMERSDILTQTDIASICTKLPFKLKKASWQLLYKMDDKNNNFKTFFNAIGGYENALVIIKTDENDIIGSFMSPGIHAGRQEYSKGDALVFSLDDEVKSFKWSPLLGKYFVLCTEDEIAIGTVGGGSAIWFDARFEGGLSEPSSSFNSPQLTRGKHFSFSNLEIWKIGGSQSRRTSVV